ncbi:unnamed protein product [Closterium sp. NIES-65]|nr:unnamed protein product [Closterium sp. NIES-65]
MGVSRYHRRFHMLVPLVMLWLVVCALPSARSDDDDDDDEGDDAVTGACEVSSLAGYKYAVDLSGSGLYLHWAPKGTTEMDFAIEARPGSRAESTWVSVGWSSGRMAPADAVMGNLPGNKVAAYSIQGYDMGSVVPTTAFSVAAAEVLTSNGGSTVSKFTRTIGDGDFPVAPDANTLIWAFSESVSQGLDYHGGNFPYQVLVCIIWANLVPHSACHSSRRPVVTPSRSRSGIVNIDFTCASGAAPATGAPDSITGGGGSSSGSSSGGGGGGGGASCPASSLAGFDYQAELTPGYAQTPIVFLRSSSTASRPPRPSSIDPFARFPLSPAISLSPPLPPAPLPLPANSLLLHWKPASATSLDMALEATASGGAAGSWISVAWTGDGRMVPSDAVIGNMPGGAAGAYAISGYDMGSIAKTTTFSVGAAATETSSGGSAIVKFTRTEGEGSIPMSLSAPNALIWAYSGSGSQSLDYHGNNFGSKTVSFNCGGSSTTPTTPTTPPTTASPPPAVPAPSPPVTTPTPPTTSPSAPGASGSNSSGPACTPSSLDGYTCSEKLSGNDFVLHWKTNGDSIDLACEVATTGWVSLGWSADGKMYPADAVVGNLPSSTTMRAASTTSGGATVASYSVAGYSESDITPAAATLPLAATAVETSSNGKTVVKFSRSLAGGDFPIDTSAMTNLIWAFSADGSKTLANHGGNRGSAAVSFAAGAAASSPPSGSGSGSALPLPSPPLQLHPTLEGHRGLASFILHWNTTGANIAFACKVATTGFVLHWTTTGANIALACEVATTGWVSLGWSADGKMYPADAVVGNLPSTTTMRAAAGSAAGSATTVASYSIAGYSESDVTPAAATLPLTATAVETSSNGKTVIRFSRAMAKGEFPMSATGPTKVIWAYSADGSKALANHGPNRYILHWKANTSTISFAAEVATSGWVSLGWNSNGKMEPADAAIGNLPPGSNSAAVGPYSITGYGASDISATSAFAMSGTTVESAANGKTVVKFTRPMAGGSYPINTNGPTTVIWAYSADGSQTLANHGPNCGSAQIDFISGSSVSTSSSSSSTAFIIHGWLLGIAFGILMPAAILISRIFLADKLQEKPPGVDHIQWEEQIARCEILEAYGFRNAQVDADCRGCAGYRGVHNRNG